MCRSHCLRLLQGVLLLGVLAGCQDSPSDRRGVSPDGSRGEAPKVSTPAVETIVSAADLQQELLEFQSEFERYNATVSPFLSSEAVSFVDEERIIEAHKTVLEEVMGKGVRESEAAYTRVLDQWKQVRADGDFTRIQDASAPWKNLQVLGSASNAFESFEPPLQRLAAMKKPEGGLVNPFEPNFKSNGLNQKLLRQLTEFAEQQMVQPKRMEYRRVKSWSPTIDEKGYRISDVTEPDSKPVDTYPERPQNVARVIDQAIDVRLERLLLEGKGISVLGDEVRSRLIRTYKAKGYEPFALTRTTSDREREVAQAQMMSEIRAVVQAAVRQKARGVDVLLSESPARISSKVLTRLGVDLTRDDQSYVLAEGELVSLARAKEGNGVNVKLWRNGASVEGGQTPGGEFKPLTPAVYALLHNDVLKIYVTALAFKKEFRGLFDYLRDAPEFKEDQDMRSLLKELDANDKLPLDLTQTGRRFRRFSGGINLDRFSLNNVYGGQIARQLPVAINIAGHVLEKRRNVFGNVAISNKNTVFGFSGVYMNSSNNLCGMHQESSIIVAHKLGHGFVEAQLGKVGVTRLEDMSFQGHRSSLIIGFDHSYLSPFVELLYRKGVCNNMVRKNIRDTSAFAGVELEISEFSRDSYRLSFSALSKFGCSHQTDLESGGKQLEVKGFLEMRAMLQTGDGVKVSSELLVGGLADARAAFSAFILR